METVEPNVLPHVWVPMRDGTRLSAALHWPPGVDPERPQGSFPALIEYHPYRKDDKSAGRASDHHYFARHGYVSVRLDVRGTGSSEGVNTDEYMPVESEDGYDAVEWLAAQPWSNGRVGMFGSSYGGFTCFQVAMQRPPHLKAIIPIYATDDRYTDDCHYKGGAFKAYYDIGTYGTMMVSLNGLPPGPEAREAGWEAKWRNRLGANEPYMLQWLDHQTDGPYWRPGSLRDRYEAVEAATFFIGGWQDGYPNPLFRTYESLRCPKKLLVGPWNHSRPAVAVPGPRIDYLHEMRRWYDLWLRNEDDGVSAEPPVVYFVQAHDPPDPARDQTSGYWRAEWDWPPNGYDACRWRLRGGIDPSGGKLLDQAAGEVNVVAAGGVQSPGLGANGVVGFGVTRTQFVHNPTSGTCGGLWSGGLPFGLPSDQRRDEIGAAVFTSDVLAAPVLTVGNSVARLFVSADAEVATLVAKLCDVAPDGSVALVSRGVLNMTRRGSMQHPEKLVPRKIHEVRVELDNTCWRFESGHRLRLTISGADFPNSWPTPEHATITLHHDESRPAELVVPTILGLNGAAIGPSFRPSPATGPSRFNPGTDVWRYYEDIPSGTVTLEVGRSATLEHDHDRSTFASDQLNLSADPNAPAEVVAEGRSLTRLDESKQSFESIAQQRIRSTRDFFHLTVDLQVRWNDEVYYSKRWERSFPRELL